MSRFRPRRGPSAGAARLVLACALLLACAAAAPRPAAAEPADPNLDRIGLYYDTGGQAWNTTWVPPGQPFPLYLLLTRPSVDEGLEWWDYVGVSGWECKILFEEGPFYVLGYELAGGINISTPPEFTVGVGTGDLALQQNDGAVVLLTMTVMLMSEDTVEFYLGPCASSSFEPPAPGYSAGDDVGHLLPLQVSTGPNPSFVFNGPASPIVGGDWSLTAAQVGDDIQFDWSDDGSDFYQL